MIQRAALRYGLYGGAIAALLALTGIFTEFAEREVITGGVLSLSILVLMLMLGAPGFFAARYARRHNAGVVVMLLNSLLASLVVTAILLALVLVQSQLDPAFYTFVFINLRDLGSSPLMFGAPLRVVPVYPLPFGAALDITFFNSFQSFGGLALLAGFGTLIGLLVGLTFAVPRRVQQTVLLALGLTAVIGMLENQIRTIITLPDALALALTFAAAYALAWRVGGATLTRRMLIGLAVGAAAGVLLVLVGTAGGLESGTRLAEGGFEGRGILRGMGTAPVILALTLTSALPFVLVMMAVGLVGAQATRAARATHNGMLFFGIALLLIGVLNAQGASTLTAAVINFLILALALLLLPPLGSRAEAQYTVGVRVERQTTSSVMLFAALAVFIVAPIFMGQYITNAFNLMAVYVIMGIGLNIMVGYSGLLDLGFVAPFAIGAYSIGLLTTPNILTCGGLDPREVSDAAQVAAACTGMMDFWVGLPISMGLAALARLLLGIPVLRLRGDYFAIVTLGFGEIINRLLIADDLKALLGGAQGITPIPSPVIDLPVLGIHASLDNPGSIYYLFLFSILIAAFVVTRLTHTRLGRAWRALRADEDVAQAMGMNTTATKLLAFGLSSAIAGMAGALFAVMVRSTFPNSFTLFVSINVLSLIIIGGMGSIPGVVLGALMLIGLPEVLRELDTYRLLAFGVLLVVAMLLKPDGLLPPAPPKLAEKAAELQAKEGAAA